jgi:hypothetical protein
LIPLSSLFSDRPPRLDDRLLLLPLLSERRRLREKREDEPDRSLDEERPRLVRRERPRIGRTMILN